MKELFVKCVKAIIFLLLIAVCQAKNEFQRQEGNGMGLFPFPRVGRSDPNINSEYLGKLQNRRRREGATMGLFPFPRVGRSDPSYPDLFAGRNSVGQPQSISFPAWIIPDGLIEYQKRNTGTNVNNGGMWFGPRLGRLQKRSFDFNDAPWAYVALKDSSSGNRETDYPTTTRIGHESEEDNDDAIVEEVISSRRMDTKNRNNISQQ